MGVLGFGLVMGITAYAAAEPLVGLLLGPGYEASIPVLRILALLPPAVALGTVLGIHWALPRGLDRPFYRLVLVGGALNILMAVILAPRFGAMGMAVSVVSADGVVSLGLLALYRIRTGRTSASEPTAPRP
jgi:PST family polysaccharide transporter